MHIAQFVSVQGVGLLQLLVLLPHGQYCHIFGEAAFEPSANQHDEIVSVKGEHRKGVDQDARPSSPIMTFKTDSYPTTATFAEHHHMAKRASFKSLIVAAHALNLARVPALARVSSAQQVVQVDSTENQIQASSAHDRYARSSMAQHRDSKLQGLMRRSENSRRRKGAGEHKFFSWPMQVFNDGHMSVLPAEKARTATGFDNHPSDSTGKQAFIIDQSGDVAPDLELAPRRDEHVLGKPRSGLAEQKASASEDLDAERASQTPTTLAPKPATQENEGQLSIVTVIIVVLLLIAIFLLLDMSLNNRIREIQNVTAATDRVDTPSVSGSERSDCSLYRRPGESAYQQKTSSSRLLNKPPSPRVPSKEKSSQRLTAPRKPSVQDSKSHGRFRNSDRIDHTISGHVQVQIPPLAQPESSAGTSSEL